MRTALILFLFVPAGPPQEDEKRIRQLIEQLGADDFDAREKAEQELRTIGAPAAPHLEKALDDSDAERADRARRILDAIRKAPKPAKPEEAFAFVVRDRAIGLTLKRAEDGSVELTVPETEEKSGKKVYRTYKAESLEKLKAAHPELAKRYDLDGYVPRPVPLEEFQKWWAERRKRFFDEVEKPDLLDREGWKKWVEEQRKLFETPFDKDWRKWFDEQLKGLERPPEEPAPKAAPVPGELGIRVDVVSETLRAQLELKEGEGVQVDLVKEGSLAERAGLKRHDIIVAMNGKPVADKWEFRQAVRQSLAKGFELEVIRGGKRQKVDVPAEKK
jgi:hypothetical protein